ncbi:MAG: putative toxin-antitoxin system toxin component, PIN family [Dehalococcoidia bacterium]|nr:MAG: putative toxin-antitoxin system toxin component, PIN family [Dehalococcoidia bacterium]
MALAPETRVFLDTNVIFSGLYSHGGAPGVIIEAFVKGEIKAVISQQVLEELVRTVKEKLPVVIPVLKAMLVNSPPEIVPDPSAAEIKTWASLLEAGDAAILAAVISSRADYFVTGDNHFFENRDVIKKAGISILTPAQFIARMGKQK